MALCESNLNINEIKKLGQKLAREIEKELQENTKAILAKNLSEGWKNNKSWRLEPQTEIVISGNIPVQIYHLKFQNYYRKWFFRCTTLKILNSRHTYLCH